MTCHKINQTKVLNCLTLYKVDAKSKIYKVDAFLSFAKIFNLINFKKYEIFDSQKYSFYHKFHALRHKSFL
jgi:hypothetical protein